MPEQMLSSEGDEAPRSGSSGRAQRRQVQRFPDGKSGIRTQCGKVNVSSRAWILSFLLTSGTSQMICPDLASPSAEPGWTRLGQGGHYCQQDLRAPKNPSAFFPESVQAASAGGLAWPSLPRGPKHSPVSQSCIRAEGLKALSPVLWV